jgi:hypothetical protein
MTQIQENFYIKYCQILNYVIKEDKKWDYSRLKAKSDKT